MYTCFLLGSLSLSLSFVKEHGEHMSKHITHIKARTITRTSFFFFYPYWLCFWATITPTSHIASITNYYHQMLLWVYPFFISFFTRVAVLLVFHLFIYLLHHHSNPLLLELNLKCACVITSFSPLAMQLSFSYLFFLPLIHYIN